MKSGKIPSWVLILVGLAITPLALYGFVTTLDRAEVGGVSYQLLAYTFLIPVFAILAYIIGTIIEDEKEIRSKNTSEYRQSQYKSSIGKSRRRYRL